MNLDKECFTGNPPFAGWWHTPTVNHPDGWRWFDGVGGWSPLVLPHYQHSLVRDFAAVALGDQPACWTWYWPENARVARQFPADFPGFAPLNELATRRKFVDPRRGLGVTRSTHGAPGNPQNLPKIDATTDLFAEDEGADEGFDFS